MNARLLDRLIQLTDEAMAALTANQPLSAVIYKAIRIARLRNDWENVWWLEMELCSVDRDEEIDELKKRLIADMGSLATRARIEPILTRAVHAYMTDRTITAISDDKNIKKGQTGVAWRSVLALEQGVDDLDRMSDTLQVPQGLHPVDLYFRSDELLKAKLSLTPRRTEQLTILGRITARVHAFLSTTEQQLFLGHVNSDIFERNRQYVDKRLLEVAPDVAEQFAAAYKRLDSDDGSEALSHALTSCRRALKSLADRLYPASDDPVVSADGVSRMLADDKFVSRLWQYIHANAPNAAGRLALAQADDLGHRLDRLNDLSSKGVHSTVNVDDAHQCVIQTYLLIGDVLRVGDPTAPK